LPGFYVRGGRRTRYGATQHISVVLTACSVVSHSQGASCELAIAVTEVAARWYGSSWPPRPRSRSRSVLRLHPRRQSEVCCDPPSISLPDLPGPTTTGIRSSPRKEGNECNLSLLCEALVID